MSDTFRFVALPSEKFAAYFALTDSELLTKHARRIRVKDKPGTPCRVSLADAELNEEVLLVPFIHHDVDSPYRASGPIFVRQGVKTAIFGRNEIPLMFRHRLLSIRAYDANAMMIDAEVIEGGQLETGILRIFANRSVEYLHLHNARPGCFSCKVERA